MSEEIQKSTRPWNRMDGVSVGLPSADRVLVLAPHPDDESLGCGGTLALYGERGTDVRLVTITYGEGLQPEDYDLPNLRKQEALEAASILGIRQHVFLGLSDGALVQCKREMKLAIAEIFKEYRPDLFFAPSPIDVHLDHLAVSEVAIELLQENPWIRLAFYEVYAPLRFNVLVDITEAMSRKEMALKRYNRSLQNLPHVYSEAMRGLHAYRNLWVGNTESRLYEAFWVVSGVPDRRRMMDWIMAGHSATTQDPAGQLLRQVKAVDRMIAEVRTLEELVKRLEARQGALVEAKDREIRRLEDLHRELEIAIGRLTLELGLITTSRGWKFLTRLYRLRDACFPPDTRRRKYYTYFLKGFVVMKTEGIGGIWKRFQSKAAQRRRSREISAPPELVKFVPEIIPFDIPTVGHVMVSIVIPVYNQSVYTYNCIKSIAEKVCLGYEVVVVNNGSTDDTEAVLSAISNITVISNQENLGFVEACNQGAKYAKGQYLLFLNNDTQVTEGAVEQLVETMEKDKQIGVVGAKLLYPDGRLQEVGAIVWKDGTAINYGHGDDPEMPGYSYMRDVDYCSGACLLVRRAVFERLGGFDLRYASAYYEDTDLCFAVRRLGYRVVCQPLARVYHHEGITAGTDLSSGLKRYQVINQRTFAQKWGVELSTHYLASQANVIFARDRRPGKRILVVDHFVPPYDKDSGSFRMFSLLKILSGMGHKVSFWPDNLMRDEPYSAELQKAGIEVLYAPYVNTIDQYFKECGNYFDVIVLCRVTVAERYIEKVRRYAPHAVVIFDTVDLHFLREQREACLKKDAALFELAELRRMQELGVASRADLTLVVSQVEKEVLLRYSPHLRVEILSNIHDVHGSSTPFAQREGILFVAGFNHPPNTDAAIYFVYEVLPIIRQSLGDVTTYLVGSDPPPEVLSLASKNVVVTGHVPDIAPFFHRCRLSVAPLRYGAGVKGKINMSMSFGLPVVATSLAVEGMYLTDGLDVLVADSFGSFAEAVVRLYRDEILWTKLSENGMKNVDEHFSATSAKTALQRILPV